MHERKAAVKRNLRVLCCCWLESWPAASPSKSCSKSHADPSAPACVQVAPEQVHERKAAVKRKLRTMNICLLVSVTGRKLRCPFQQATEHWR